MFIITAKTQISSYPVYIGRQLLANNKLFNSLLTNTRIVLVTDPIVAKYHLPTVLASLNGYAVDVVNIEAGEQHKNWDAIQQILVLLADKQHDRYSTLISLGGGVVGDLAGFAASIFMRGINLIHIPTTLLAQVDSCIGGKTGINYLGIKNLVGSFYQPQAVIIDNDVISTLPDREYISGLAEVVKYGMACDADFFEWLENHTAEINSKQSQALALITKRCCEFKLHIVQQDEQDRAQRLVLNFGHTFAHALEASTNFSYYLHGEAVAIGMLLATWMAVKLGLVELALFKRLQSLLQALNLPISGEFRNYSATMLYSYILNDKKKNAQQLALILPCELGKVKVFKDIDEKQLESLMEEYAGI